jgi:hypothetical protein
MFLFCEKIKFCPKNNKRELMQVDILYKLSSNNFLVVKTIESPLQSKPQKRQSRDVRCVLVELSVFFLGANATTYNGSSSGALVECRMNSASLTKAYIYVIG